MKITANQLACALKTLPTDIKEYRNGKYFEVQLPELLEDFVLHECPPANITQTPPRLIFYWDRRLGDWVLKSITHTVSSVVEVKNSLNFT